MTSTTKQQGASNDTRTIVTVLLLIFFPLVGLVLMWAWTNWKKWVKWLITCVFIAWTLLVLLLFGIFLAAMIATIDPKAQIQKAEEVTELNMCIDSCVAEAQATQGAAFDLDTSSAACQRICLTPPTENADYAPSE